MLGGILFSLIFLSTMALSDSLRGILLSYMLLQVASNTAHGPAQGLIPDLVPPERRGLAAGVKNLFDMSGLIVTSLVAGHLLGQGNVLLAFAVTGGILATGTLITLLTTPERPTFSLETPITGHGLRMSLRRYPNYTRLLVSRFFILLGIYAVQGFAQYYIRDWLGMPDPAQVTGNLLAAIGVALILLVFPAGILSDRIGRVRLNLLAGALAALGIFLLVFARNVVMLYIFGGIIGMATGIFLSVNWALATDLIPQEEAGKYLGLSNLATAGAGATSRLGGPLIDGLNALRPGTYVGYPALFLLASIMTLLGTLLIFRIHQSDR